MLFWRCSRALKPVTLLENQLESGASAHCRGLENLYPAAPVNRHFESAIEIAEGRWISGRKRVYVADARLIDTSGEEAARGTGPFMRSSVALTSLAGYHS
jgi:hypothetical protein